MEENNKNSSYACFSFTLGKNETFQVSPIDDIFLSTKTHMDWYQRDNTYDIITKVIFAPFRNQFFLFLLVVLALHRKHWNNLSVIVLFFHWLLRGMADGINMFCSLYSHMDDPRIYVHQSVWNIKIICHFIWYTGENIGDYYLLNRTLPFVRKEKYKILLCLTKLSYVLLCLTKYMVSINQLMTNRLELIENNSCDYHQRYWLIQLSIASLVMIFDLLIYLNMRINVFNDNEINENPIIKNSKAWKTFKKISYIRMEIVLIFGICAFLSFLIPMLHDELRSVNIQAFRALTVNGPYIMYYIDNIFMSETDLVTLEESISYGQIIATSLKIQ